MRLGVILVLLFVFGGTQAQIALGPQGLQTPPINLVAVFRFIRDIVIALFTSSPKDGFETTEIKTNDIIETNEIPETRSEVVDEEESSDDNTLSNNISVIGFDEEGNIVEKLRENIEEEEESQNTIIERFDYGVWDEEDDASELKTTSSGALVVGTWPLIYLGIISVLFWGLVIVATPYVLTGEPIGRREDIVHENSIVNVDEQDILLLLSWLLGEASYDRSCLKRVICMSPVKSSRYIHVSSMIMNVAEFLQIVGVPYSAGYDELIWSLNDVAQDGMDNSCHMYSCPTLPEF